MRDLFVAARTPLLSAALFALFTGEVRADDWPQWLGPRRDSVWRETGVVREIPESGLPVRWRTPVELGYSGPAVANGKVFVMDYVRTSGRITNNAGSRDKLEGLERVLCLDAETGKVLWKHEYERSYSLSYPGGPRCTPTVAEGRVYALGAEGDLTCLESESGGVVWHKNLPEEYGAPTPIWGYACHPLVAGGIVYCLAGGDGNVAVALDAATGDEIWTALSAGDAGYCPPTLIEHNGRDQLLIWSPESLNGLDPKSGQVFWSVPLKPDYGMSIAAPLLSGDRLFASGVRSTGVAIDLNGVQTPTEVWRGAPKTALYSATTAPIIDDGIIYGCDGPSGTLVAASLEDGARLWQTAEPTTGDRGARYATVFLVKHEDRYFLFNESGDLILAKLSPQGYSEEGRFHVLAPTNATSGRDLVWSHPAFAEQCLFARNDKEIVCVDLAAGAR